MITPKRPNKPTEGKAASAKPSVDQKIAAVLIRGTVGHTPAVNRTLALLKLYKKNCCVVYPKTESIKGMLIRIKDFITWGDLDDGTHALLLEKRGKKGEQQTVFHLNPPRGGYGRKGIKQPFSVGGGLGDRGQKINDLLKRMLQ